MRLMLRRTVLLPQPDGPMKAVIVCFLMSMRVSRTAWKSP